MRELSITIEGDYKILTHENEEPQFEVVIGEVGKCRFIGRMPCALVLPRCTVTIQPGAILSFAEVEK